MLCTVTTTTMATIAYTGHRNRSRSATKKSNTPKLPCQPLLLHYAYKNNRARCPSPCPRSPVSAPLSNCQMPIAGLPASFRRDSKPNAAINRAATRNNRDLKNMARAARSSRANSSHAAKTDKHRRDAQSSQQLTSTGVFLIQQRLAIGRWHDSIRFPKWEIQETTPVTGCVGVLQYLPCFHPQPIKVNTGS